MPDAGRQGGRPQSDSPLLVTFAPQRQPCLHVERCPASERARRHRDESSRDEHGGRTRCRRADWPRRRDGGKPNHTPKAYHHAQRRLGTARDMGDPWLECNRRAAGDDMDITGLCYTSAHAALHLSGRARCFFTPMARSLDGAQHHAAAAWGRGADIAWQHGPAPLQHTAPKLRGTLLSRCRSG
jgi:hypothetical protein